MKTLLFLAGLVLFAPVACSQAQTVTYCDQAHSPNCAFAVGQPPYSITGSLYSGAADTSLYRGVEVHTDKGVSFMEVIGVFACLALAVATLFGVVFGTETLRDKFREIDNRLNALENKHPKDYDISTLQQHIPGATEEQARAAIIALRSQ